MKDLSPKERVHMDKTDAIVKPLKIQMEFNPKTYEIDFSGVLSNIVYVKWMEDLRLAMLAKYLPLRNLMENEMAPMIMSTEIHYKSPVVLFDTVLGEAWLKNLGRSSWDVAIVFTIAERGCIAAEAEQRGLFINLRTQRPVRMPEELTARYQQELLTNSPPQRVPGATSS